MPKSNFCRDKKKEEREAKETAIKEMISGRMTATGINNDELARRAGINARTLYSRRKNPGSMKLEELWAIMSVLNPESYYKEKIV